MAKVKSSNEGCRKGRSSLPKLGLSKGTSRGFSLVEILVAVAIFAMLVSAVGFFAIDSFRSSENSRRRVSAMLYAQEFTDAMMLKKADRWSDVLQNSDGNPKHFEFIGNQYEIVDGEEIKDGITLSFTLAPVQRGESGEIVEEGGTEDIHTRLLTFNASWQDVLGVARSFNLQTYINDWNTIRWLQTTVADFDPGEKDLTLVTNNDGGEIELETIIYADWCNPDQSLTAYDLPRQGIAKGVDAILGEAIAGTGENASGVSFTRVLIDEEYPPNVTVEGEFDGYKTNDVFVEPGYAYIGTDTNSKEVVIIDTSSLPYVEAGSFDAPGNKDGDSLVVAGDYGYVTVDTELYVFDVSQKTGARPQVGAGLDLGGVGNNTEVDGNYLYVTIGGDQDEMKIIDITNPSNPAIVGSVDVNTQDGVDVSISEDAQRAYIATAESGTEDEFFIVDISDKTGSRPVIGSYNTNGMDPTGVVVVPDQRAIIVGVNEEEYQVVDIEDEANPFRCGGLQIDTGITGIDALKNSKDEAYSYIITWDADAELKLVRGGPGGGGEGGVGHAPQGSFVSSVFDTNSTSSVYYSISWSEQIPVGTDMRVQIRTGDSPDLSGVGWFGPDGTSSTYFTENGGEYIPELADGHRYVQYRVIFYSDTISTPILESIGINYQL